jgi:hypothetical protein
LKALPEKKKVANDVLLMHSEGLRRKKLDPTQNIRERQAFEKSVEHLYLFGRETRFELDIDCLYPSEKRNVVRKLEKEGIEKQVEYFTSTINIVKQSICVMPDMATRPKDWQECIVNNKFVIINGQHSIMASKKICADEEHDDEDLKMKLKKWDCFVVWGDSSHQLNTLSTKYNEPNLLGNWASTLPKTIAHCRELWVENGRPLKVRKNAIPGSKEEEIQKKNWDIFISRCEGAFTSNSLRKNKVDFERLGERSIIMASDETYEKWKSVFERHEDGTLIDPRTMTKMNAIPKGDNKTGVLPYVYKPLTSGRLRGMMNIGDKALAECADKILDLQPTIWFVKEPSSNPTCRKLEDWIDRKKNKTLIVSLINEEYLKLDSLPNNKARQSLIDTNGEVDVKQWKRFKKKYLIMGRHMDELIRSAGETYFMGQRIKNFKDKPNVPEECKLNIRFVSFILVVD